jgi:hypothetical protein
MLNKCGICCWIFADADDYKTHDCKDYNKTRALGAENTRLKERNQELMDYISACESMIPSAPDKGNLLPVKIKRLKEQVVELERKWGLAREYVARHRERQRRGLPGFQADLALSALIAAVERENRGI